MPEQYPVNDQARNRLRDAQKSEAQALRAVLTAQKARDRQQDRLNQANRELDATHVKLIEVSGIWRAARLAGEDAKAMRDKARAAGIKPGQLQ